MIIGSLELEAALWPTKSAVVQRHDEKGLKYT